MSSMARRLRKIFTAPPPVTAKTPAQATTLSSPSKSGLQQMVEEFKKSSESKRFRSRYLYYEKTVLTLARAKKFSLIEDILEHQKQYNDISNEVFTVRIITLYGRAGMFEQAYKLFDEMPNLNCERTVMSFNALLSACINSKKFDQVSGFFQELPASLGIVPDVVSYNIIIKGFCESGSLHQALSVLNEMKKAGLEPDSITFNTLLFAFYEKGSYTDGENIWDLMKKNNVTPNVNAYNAKLRGLVSENRMTEAVELIDEMKTGGIKPDVFTYNTLIKGFCVAGNPEEAKRWYREIGKNEGSPVWATYTTLIPFFVDKGDFDMAYELCKEVYIKRKDVNGWRWAIELALLRQVVDGLVKESKIEEATELEELGNLKKKALVTPELPEL